MSVTQSEAVNAVNSLIPLLQKDAEFQTKKWPVRSNWASKMGHDCERWLYYNRHDWDKVEGKNWKGIGELGDLIADWWKRRAIHKGYRVIHAEVALKDEIAKKYQIGGRIDCRVGIHDIRPVLTEVKSMKHEIWEKINTYEDIVNSKLEWVRGYPAQLQLYLISENEEAGLFVLISKLTLEAKFIPVYLDYGYTEWLLKRAERVNKANEKSIPPKRISYGKVCEKCDFKGLCLPDIANEGYPLIDNDELELKIKERDSLKESRDRFEELDKETKGIAKKYGKDFIVGTSYKAEIKKSEQIRVDTKSMPLEVRSQYEKKSEVIKVTFIPIEKAKI